VVHNVSGADVTVALGDDVASYSKIFYKNKNATLKNRSLTIPAFSSVLLKK
jgi:hypothetical protein